ncbi:hypothetical protein K08M3_50630 [Vibrio alginolyticus]|uniref:Uncharacterized protein n=1 Tax=Vibrio alginolyticus TaxID=663 RepID=A0A1W6UV05_VIBAL|nr:MULTISPECIES: hypothetical protein [Vibrio harveyi group]ARP06573.1 hypothetical protein K04M1_50500 [Vibrio alginolyticus]ARP11706.1 hypothetical protein K04M3_51370 [Vibrio alginolyticus]ARP16759.1 hypothetical protein K04M5_51070 [Vibrio alginolyticus]ARP21796.1 hypothetical protein K05K4_50940 [Vibrio alginolyticus]ARP26859.1 hypothetical protein K06K5_50590 [Vibrio alginolyticus]
MQWLVDKHICLTDADIELIPYEDDAKDSLTGTVSTFQQLEFK